MKKICTWLLILAMLLTCLPPVSLASQADGDGRIRPVASRQDHNTLGLVIFLLILGLWKAWGKGGAE